MASYREVRRTTFLIAGKLRTKVYANQQPRRKTLEFREVYGLRVSECGVVIGRRGKPLKPWDNGRGYLIVKVKIDGKNTSKAVHRLVAEAWIPNPNNLPEVNHKDLNRYNCHKDNLEWMTHGQNIEYSYKMEGRSATGENNARAVVTEAVVVQICELLEQGLSAAEIRDKGFDYGRVRAIKRGQNWQHISKNYKWFPQGSETIPEGSRSASATEMEGASKEAVI